MNKTTTTLSALLLCALAATARDAAAVGTRNFVLDSLPGFEGGDLEGVAVASDGTVRAGWTTANAPIPDATSVWSAAVLDDGSVLLGTGTGGRIYQVKNGKVTIAAETGTMAVSALAIGPGGDVIAGTFPGGKVFRIKPAELDGGQKKPWLELADTESVWALAYEPKSKAVYAATGAGGQLYRISDGGKADVFYDSEEDHLVSVAVASDGAVYAGSNGKALLFKITGPGRAEVVYDFEGDDVKAIAIDGKGAVYAVANKYADGGGLPQPRASGDLESKPSTPKPARAGKGELWRFSPGGVAEAMIKDNETHFVALVLDAEGTPFVGTGAEGRVYSVDDNHVKRLVVDTDERQVGALMVDGKARFVAGSDPVVFHEIKGSGGAEAVWTSKTLDAGLRAHWGKLEWVADGALELQTRSGNTDKPDNSWSAWSGAMSKPSKIGSPPARFLQIRARWNKDPSAVLREVQVAFVTDNARALVTEITAGTKKKDSSGDAVPESGTKPDDPDTKLKLSWKVENPDSDQLRYFLFYRREGDKTWFSVLEPNEELTSTSHTWDTAGMPEGRYRVRVDASDELSNPPDRVTKHSLESRVLVIDNTAPVLSNLQLNGNRLQGTATDQVGPISRIEFALVGKKSWWPVFPTDAVFDDATESFDVDVSALIPSGPHLVVVRAYDANGNRVERTVSRGR